MIRALDSGCGLTSDSSGVRLDAPAPLPYLPAMLQRVRSNAVAFVAGALAAAATLTAQAPAPAHASEPAVASYVSSRLNGKPLPVIDLASDSSGVKYLIEFDELILTIRENHEFRAALKYRQTLASKGGKLGRDPLQKMTVYGTWATAGNAIRFVPDPRRGGTGLQILAGTFDGPRIDVPFDYHNGRVSRRATVLLIENDRIF